MTCPEPPQAFYELLPDSRHTTREGPGAVLLDWLARERVRRIRRLAGARKPVSVLDVGGGACRFANAAARAGFEVSVIEPNEKNRGYARPEVRFVSGFFSPAAVDEKKLPENTFDVVTMWHALEHLPDPAAALRTVERLLKPGGVFYVSVPDIRSLQARLGANDWAYLDVPHHRFHFTRASLDRLAGQVTFEKIRDDRFSAEYDIFGWFQTLMNRTTHAHNYFHNRFKKGRMDMDYVPHPFWTRVVTVLAPLYLAPAVFMSLASWLGRDSSCVEAAYRKPIRTTGGV